MKPFDEWQEAELRLQMRRMYNDVGLDESLKALHEIILSGAILAEVISEELERK